MKTVKGRGQYKGLKWEAETFPRPHKTPNGVELSGYHVREFRITEEDIRKAVLKVNWKPKKGEEIPEGWEWAKKSFDSSELPEGYVEFDPDTGNFHKKATQGRFQIALIDKAAKERAHEGVGTRLQKKEDMIRELKENRMYFPNIDDYDSDMTEEEAKAEMFKVLGME